MIDKLLILSLGGSLEPLRISLTHHRPTRVLVYASQGSAVNLAVLAQELGDSLQVFECMNPNDIADCHAVALRCLETAFNTPCGHIVVDFTGGTKVMSAALVLACRQRDVTLSYVGGDSRAKNGLGTVTDGSEMIVCRQMKQLREGA